MRPIYHWSIRSGLDFTLMLLVLTLTMMMLMAAMVAMMVMALVAVMNPVEMFWGWLRKKLRSMDLEDLRKKRRPLGKTTYIARVKRVLKSAKAQAVAQNAAGRFRKACKQVADRNGAAADN